MRNMSTPFEENMLFYKRLGALGRRLRILDRYTRQRRARVCEVRLAERFFRVLVRLADEEQEKEKRTNGKEADE